MMHEELVSLPDLLAQTREVSYLFDQLVSPWTPEVMMSELVAEVGTLADSVMITQHHRPPRSDAPPIDLEDDVTDVLFMLLRIADHYHINLHVPLPGCWPRHDSAWSSNWQSARTPPWSSSSHSTGKILLEPLIGDASVRR